MPKTVVLVGLMGAGKSTIGRLLAKILKLPFKDTDQEIEHRAGADISWIFDQEQEHGFRQREAAVLADLLSGEPMVLATGGGIVTQEENRELLKGGAEVVYLSASPELLYSRIQKDKRRPLLQVDNPLAVMKSLFEQRDPYYREVSNHIITTGTSSPKHVAQEIAKAIGVSSHNLH